MAIIMDHHSKVIIQGITGKTGAGFAERMLKFGTPVVGGVTPGKGGATIHGLPVFNTVEETVKDLDANVSFVSVPARHVEQAVFEAIDAGIKVIVIYTEGLTPHEGMKLVNYAELHGVTLIGPNSAGVVSTGKTNASDIQDSILLPGSIGIVSRSGTLTYEIVELLKQEGLGTSTIACLGGDPIIGLQHYRVLEMFEADQETDLVIYLGEIGGQDEWLSAQTIKKMKTPVISYIAGNYAPANKQMGHAGAIIKSGEETAKAKQQILEQAGANPITVITELIPVIRKLQGSKNLSKAH